MVVGSSGVGIDVDEFVGKCISFMRNADPNDDEEEDGDAMDWGYLGRAAAFKGNKRPATSDFLLGPLSVQKKVRVQKARKQGLSRKKGEKSSQPTDVDVKDIKTSENNTLKLVRQVHHILKAYMEENDLPEDALPLFEAVINPESFGQTIENIFFVSFLAKEGWITVYEDDDTELPMIGKFLPGDLGCIHVLIGDYRTHRACQRRAEGQRPGTAQSDHLLHDYVAMETNYRSI
jgi:hypothetical protein